MTVFIKIDPIAPRDHLERRRRTRAAPQPMASPTIAATWGLDAEGRLARHWTRG